MEKFKKVKLASILGTIGNLFLFVIKILIGLITNSHAMIADSFNSLGDIFSSAMTYVGNRISSKPKDECHNMGHGKAEYIYSLFISIVMLYVSISLAFKFIKAFLYNETVIFSYWLITVCIVTIFVKLFLFIYTSKISKKYKNLLMEANSKDHRNDLVITSLNLISCLLGIKIFDIIVGIVISLWIAWSALEIFLRSYDVLMDKSIDEETKNKVLAIIKSHKEIVEINHFNSTPVGYQYQISFTIFVDGNLSTFESHEIADKLEDEIEAKLPEIFLTVIHVNPIDLNSFTKEDLPKNGVSK